MSYRRSATSSKRSKQAYLTNPKAIAHIARKVDEAIAIASQTGAVNSFEDLKDLVEGHSQETSKHPIGMELCEIDGAIRGFRFYLQADPGKTISGKHLAIKAGAETYDYTPSTLAEHLGLDSHTESDFEEEIGTDLELGDDLSDLDIADDLDAAIALDDFDDDLDFAPQQRPQKKQQAVQSKKQSSPNPAKPQKGDRYGYRQHPIEKVADSARQTTNIGAELNGLNESGLITQLATLGVAISGLGLQQLTDILEEAKRKGQEKRLQAILESLQQQNERVHNLGERLTELRSPAQPSPDEQAKEEDVLSCVTNQVGDRMNRLGRDLDPDYKSLPPIKLNPEATINQKLDQIEQYLNQMVKAIDGMEQRLEVLESAIDRPQPAQSRTEVETENPKTPAQIPANNHPSIPKAVSAEQTTVAESLVELATLNQSAETDLDNQIVDVGEYLLFIERSGEVLSINLEDNDGQLLFAASHQAGQWTVQKPLSDNEHSTVLKQLQELGRDKTLTEPEERLAKQFIRYAQEQLPDIFDGREPPVFSLESPGSATYAYDFKLQKLLTDKQQLLGVDRNQNQQHVFDALIDSDDELDVRLCKIPAEVLESLVETVQVEGRSPSAQERQKVSQNFELD